MENYQQLLAAVVSWLEKPEVTQQAPTFVRLFEARADRELRTRHQMFIKTVTIASEVMPLPCDVRSILDFRIADNVNGGKLAYCTPQQMDAKPIGMSGIPDSYTIAGDKFVFHPFPLSPFMGRVRGREAVPHLGTVNASNWLLAKHPDAYLYGSLLQAAPYLRDDERVEMWEAAVQKVLADINAEDRGFVEDALQTHSGVSDHRYWYGRSAGNPY